MSVAQCGEGAILSYKGTRSPQCEVGTSGGQNAGSRAVRSHRDTITAPRKMTIIQNDTLEVHTGFINENASADASRWGALMCLAVRKKKKKRIFHQCLTGTAVARDTKLKKAYKRPNGVLLCCLASGEHFSRNNTGFFLDSDAAGNK